MQPELLVLFRFQVKAVDIFIVVEEVDRDHVAVLYTSAVGAGIIPEYQLLVLFDGFLDRNDEPYLTVDVLQLQKP